MPAAKTTGKASTNGHSDRVIDLNAAKAARAEVDQEPVRIQFGDKTFTLPPELPAEFSLYFDEGESRKALFALLGDDIEDFLALNPSVPDVNELLTQVFAKYGTTEGE